MRSVLAVLSGYAVFAAGSLVMFRLSGHEPHADATATFKTFAILYGTGCALIGGYVAGSLAKRSPVAHASIMGLLLAAMAAISLHMSPVKSAIWTQVAALFFMAPAAILGGILCARRGTGT
jgi:hypothetical protein